LCQAVIILVHRILKSAVDPNKLALLLSKKFAILVPNSPTSVTMRGNCWQVELLFSPQGPGEKQRIEVYDFKGPGVAIGMFNTDESIKGFAHSSLQVRWLGCYSWKC
jgi:hypothetical protein